MQPLDIPVAFGLGVLSSLHCAQMCGPIVISYSLTGRASAGSHILYNAGRIFSYSLLGAVAGAAGQAMGVLAGVEHAAAIVSGVLMVAAGVFMSGAVPRGALVQIGGGGLPRFFSRTVGRLLAPGTWNKLALGLLMGLLPCGLLYAALLKAASTASPLGGAASMAAFGAGTSGTLLAIGLVSSVVRFRPGRWSSMLASAGVVLLGVVLVWRGLTAGVPHAGHHAGM